MIKSKHITKSSKCPLLLNLTLEPLFPFISSDNQELTLLLGRGEKLIKWKINMQIIREIKLQSFSIEMLPVSFLKKYVLQMRDVIQFKCFTLLNCFNNSYVF